MCDDVVVGAAPAVVSKLNPIRGEAGARGGVSAGVMLLMPHRPRVILKLNSSPAQVPNLECKCIGITPNGQTIVSGWT